MIWVNETERSLRLCSGNEIRRYVYARQHDKLNSEPISFSTEKYVVVKDICKLGCSGGFFFILACMFDGWPQGMIPQKFFHIFGIKARDNFPFGLPVSSFLMVKMIWVIWYIIDKVNFSFVYFYDDSIQNMFLHFFTF